MKATTAWINATSRRFLAKSGSSTVVHLGQYSTELHESGEGSPIVLVPGLAGGAGLLGPLAQSLATANKVFTYQLRGENDCFALRHPFDLDDLVEDLAELLDSLRLESPTLMGVSFGGLIALRFAMRFPYRLDRLILQGVGARYQRSLIHQVAGTVLSRFPLPADSAFVNQFFNLLFGGPQKRDALFDFVTRQVWQTDQSVMAHRFRLIEGLDFEEHLSEIKAPTLVFAPERDVFVSQQSAARLCEKIPDADLVRMPNCGHLAFVTKADAMVKGITSFVQAGI